MSLHQNIKEFLCFELLISSKFAKFFSYSKKWPIVYSSFRISFFLILGNRYMTITHSQIFSNTVWTIFDVQRCDRHFQYMG
jgi:hypothetical protein